jgi:hypothetical protein
MTTSAGSDNNAVWADVMTSALVANCCPTGGYFELKFRNPELTWPHGEDRLHKMLQK